MADSVVTGATAGGTVAVILGFVLTVVKLWKCAMRSKCRSPGGGLSVTFTAGTAPGIEAPPTTPQTHPEVRLEIKPPTASL